MHNYCINKLLNLEDVKVKNIIHNDHSVKIRLQTEQKQQTCPNCGSLTSRIHNYSFLARYQQRSVRLTQFIANRLRDSVSLRQQLQDKYE